MISSSSSRFPQCSRSISKMRWSSAACRSSTNMLQTGLPPMPACVRGPPARRRYPVAAAPRTAVIEAPKSGMSRIAAGQRRTASTGRRPTAAAAKLATKGSNAPHCSHPIRGLERQQCSVRSRWRVPGFWQSNFMNCVAGQPLFVQAGNRPKGSSGDLLTERLVRPRSCRSQRLPGNRSSATAALARGARRIGYELRLSSVLLSALTTGRGA